MPESSDVEAVVDTTADVPGQMPTVETPAEAPQGQMPDGDAQGVTETAQSKTYEETYVRQLRQEAQKARMALKDAATKLADYEKQEADRKKATMSEQERLQAELAEAKAALEAANGQVAALQAQRVTTEKRQAVRDEATRAEFEDPADAWRWLDLDKFELDDDGNVVGVKEAIRALAKEKPYLVRKPKPNTATINAQEGKGDQRQTVDPKERVEALRSRFRF